MSEDSIGARQALTLSTFSRLKDLVRELEDNEKRLGQDFTRAEVEFKLSADEVAWYVAYKTLADAVQVERGLATRK